MVARQSRREREAKQEAEQTATKRSDWLFRLFFLSRNEQGRDQHPDKASPGKEQSRELSGGREGTDVKRADGRWDL